MVCISLKQRLEHELKIFIGSEQTAAIIVVAGDSGCYLVFVKPQYGQVHDKHRTY